jgi:lipopolysaccharide export system permease protein
MQWLWKYIDDLVGKGLEWYIVMELLFFASASLVPLALPLAILLSSIMTFGNMGEHYELVAFKTAGISLWKIMYPLIVTSLLLSIGAFYFSNNIIPIANLKMGTLLYDIRQQRPALNIKEGIFYDGIDGYVMKVKSKSDDGEVMNNIIIYDHTERQGNTKVIIAEKGRMDISTDTMVMSLILYNGYSYKEEETPRRQRGTYPHLRTSFKIDTIRFDLSAFKLSRSDESIFKDNYQMLNISQLEKSQDTLQLKLDKRRVEMSSNISSGFKYFSAPQLYTKIDSVKTDSNAVVFSADILANFNHDDQVKIVHTALEQVRSRELYIDAALADNFSRTKVINKHKIEWHRKFTLSFACIVLFFIGAPLGAIIRKGGLGVPVVISILLFIFYHIISISGEKFVKEGLWNAWNGMWMSSLVLLPLGVFLTWKATSDSGIFNADAYLKPFRMIAEKFQAKK